ncbi:hypothetical protein Tco_0685482 [Tanacetum coccineum]
MNVKKALEKTLLQLAQSSSQTQSSLKAAESLSEYELKTILFDKMDKSRSYPTHDQHQDLYDALFNSLSLDDAIASGQANPEKVLRKRDRDDEDPSIRLNQGKKIKRRRIKESEPSKKSSNSKEPSKAKNKDIKKDWFKQPPRPPTPDPEWNKRQVVVDQPKQPWFNQTVSVAKDPLTFDKLMATPIDFSNNIELEYNMEECFKALTDRLDWNNPEGYHCPFDLTKPLPLKGRPDRLTVAVEYFFNNDLEFLKSSDLEKNYTTSIMKTKAARYEIVGIEDMVPTLWSTIKFGYNKDVEKGIKHWGEKRQRWYRSQINKFSKHNVYSI